MARIDPKFMLRLPADLRDRVQNAAGQANQSMNSLVVSVLEQAFPHPTVDLREVGHLLNALANEAEDETGMHGEGETFDHVNRGLASLESPWHVKYDDGLLIFYPYGNAPETKAEKG